MSKAIRENKIRRWFEMWLTGRNPGIEEIFSENVVYFESWGPKYCGLDAVRHWFCEWNTRGKVLVWDIKQFLHKEDQTVVEWHFKNQMNTGEIEEFDGLSLIEWTAEDNKIIFLKEFGCNTHNYDPYKNGAEPAFRDEKPKWF